MRTYGLLKSATRAAPKESYGRFISLTAVRREQNKTPAQFGNKNRKRKQKSEKQKQKKNKETKNRKVKKKETDFLGDIIF